MRYELLAAASVAALSPMVSADFLDIDFASNPTIESAAPEMLTLGNGLVLGRGLDGSDRVRFSGVASRDGNSIDAILTVLDAENRTGIAFGGGGVTIDSLFNTDNDAVVNLSNAPTSEFGAAGILDPETGEELIAGPADETTRTSARIRVDFVDAGTLDLIDPTADIGLTFFDIDGASSGPNRGRVDGLTLIDTDAFFVSDNTVLAVDESEADRVTLTPTTGRTQSPEGELERYSVTGIWTGVNSVEFEWFFDWSANGVRGVHFNGNSMNFLPTPGAAGLLALAGLAAGRRRR